jgi:hypothetical protein
LMGITAALVVAGIYIAILALTWYIDNHR